MDMRSKINCPDQKSLVDNVLLRGARQCHFSEPVAACTKRYRVAARRGVTIFFQCIMYVCKLAGAVTANKWCMSYITMPRACELYQYVTPLQGTNVMIEP